MGSKIAKITFLLLGALFCYSREQKYESSISIKVAEAFLFQQLPPSYQELNSTPSNYLNNYSQLRHNQQNKHQNKAQTNNNLAHSYYTRDSRTTNSEDSYDVLGCPRECHCDRVAQIADCSNRKLLRVPNGFPKDTKRIRLERNNITELGPYSFEGLKRLQRIDLSNNNLLKIDPLAFSGGLQSLNSLILYSNKLNQLPVNLFSELSQLQLLLLNANSIQCISKELLQPLTNLNLLSLYDNNIETLPNGTFDGLKNIKTIHLGKNPLACDCNLRWLADYLELNPIETSEARCESPNRNLGKKLSQLSEDEFKCSVNEQIKANQIAQQCAAQHSDASCPAGCVCDGATVDCSGGTSLTESKQPPGNSVYELPDIPDDIPVYVTKLKINDSRIKRIRQTGLFRRLANSQKLDLGSNRIVDIEDNAINGGAIGSAKPERVVFVLLENDHCSVDSTNNQKSATPEQLDACLTAPKVNPPNFDSPCYNGGSCVSNARSSPASISTNYSCLCPPGFAGSLCEINIDDCIEHQCQNGAMCVDGINSYKCLCRDPTTSGEFCEQLNTYTTSSANSIAPIALPIIAAGNSNNELQQQQQFNHQPQQMLARSADFLQPVELPSNHCKRITQREYYRDGKGCQSVRVLKLSNCVGSCGPNGCCSPAKLKRRRIRMQCDDGASYVKVIELVKKCACSRECGLESNLTGQYNVTQEDQLLQITRIDAVD